MNLERLETCKKMSVGLESLDACREESVNLGGLEACKRASVSLVILFEVSHGARFARTVVVTTLWHSCEAELARCATEVEQTWKHMGPFGNQVGASLGPVWDQLRTTLDPNLVQCGTRLGCESEHSTRGLHETVHQRQKPVVV